MLIEADLDTSIKTEEALNDLSSDMRNETSEFIAHHGIKGQKWGIRRYQNLDGTLTDAGKKRYGAGDIHDFRSKGRKRLVNDMRNDLNYFLDKNPNKAVAWAKTADDLGLWRDSWDVFVDSHDADQTRTLMDVYKKTKAYEKEYGNEVERAKRYTKSADDFRKSNVNHLDEMIEEFHPDLHKELGVKPGKEVRNYLIDAVKGFNEGDPDMVTYQHMDDLVDLHEKKLIDDTTFNKYYDGQAADDAIGWLGGELKVDDVKRYNGWYKELHQSDDTSDFLAHHGIKGQKWGNRRYQNHDGSLTPEGRKRYGVGPALTNLGKKAAGAAGKAIRKATGRQTDAELSEELAKARHKYDRQNAKDEINRLNGKRKKLSKMSDAEVDDYIDRLTKERNVRNMENELKRMNRSAVSNFVRDLGSGVMSNVASGVGEGIKRGVSSAIATSIEENESRKQAVKWDKHNEKHNPDKLAADKNKNWLDATRSDLELRALRGDKQAARTLNSVAKASRGNAEKDSRSSASKDALEIARNELELRAIKGDKDALKTLRKVTDAKKGSKNKPKQQNQQNQQNQQDEPKADEPKADEPKADKPKNDGKKSSKKGGQQQTQSKQNTNQSTQTGSKPKMHTQADYEAAKKRAKDNIKSQASKPVSDARTYSVSNDAIDWMAELSSRKALPPARS